MHTIELSINRGLRASKQGSSRGGEGRSAFARGDRNRDAQPAWASRGGEGRSAFARGDRNRDAQPARASQSRRDEGPKTRLGRSDRYERQGSGEPRRPERTRLETERAEPRDSRRKSSWQDKASDNRAKEAEPRYGMRDRHIDDRSGSVPRSFGGRPSSARGEKQATSYGNGRHDKPSVDRNYSDAFARESRDRAEGHKAIRAERNDHAADGLGFGGNGSAPTRQRGISEKPDAGGLRLIKHTSDGESNPFDNNGSSFTQRTKPQRRTQDSAEPQKFRDRDESSDVPLAIPYTTATSQFLYGTNVVLAALRAKRRTIHCLHLRAGSSGTYESRNDALTSIQQLARAAHIPIKYSSARLLDTLSEDRPHNGMVLEASPLSTPPIISLKKVTPQGSTIDLTLDRLSPEEPIPPPLRSPKSSQNWRKPFILFLDGITDPGNLGNIIRTAYFYGVDAVVVATNTCAPLSSPIVAKASAGACEALPIYSSPKPANFISESAKAGWRIYAAAAPELNVGASARQVHKQVTARAVSASSPLERRPVILMLGAEGEGLRANLRSKADVDVGIEGADVGGRVDVGVESLNVGVAAGVLVEAFMRRPGSG